MGFAILGGLIFHSFELVHAIAPHGSAHSGFAHGQTLHLKASRNPAWINDPQPETHPKFSQDKNSCRRPIHTSPTLNDSADIAWIEESQSGERPILFIHGSPSTHQSWLENYFCDAYPRGSKIAVDRLGYGASRPRRAFVGLKEHAQALIPLLQSFSHSQRPIIYGHSYGTPVAIRLAIDFPHLVGAIVLTGTSIEPRESLSDKFFRWVLWPMGRLAPRDWRISRAEIMELEDENRKMESHLSEITQPVFIVHGTKDRLAPLRNAHFAKKSLKNASVTLFEIQGAGHNVNNSEPELIYDILTHLVENEIPTHAQKAFR